MQIDWKHYLQAAFRILAYAKPAVLDELHGGAKTTASNVASAFEVANVVTSAISEGDEPNEMLRQLTIDPEIHAGAAAIAGLGQVTGNAITGDQLQTKKT